MKKDFIKGLIYAVLINIWIIISVYSFFYFAVEERKEHFSAIMQFLAIVFFILSILYFVQTVKLLINKKYKEAFIVFLVGFMFFIMILF